MTSKAKSHPDNGTLERYALGHLSEGEFERVEEHLFVCEFCQDELTLVDYQVRELKEALRSVPWQPKPERVGFWGRLFAIPRPVLAAACAGFLLVMVLPFATHRAAVGTPADVRLETYRAGQQSDTAQAVANSPLHLRLSDPRNVVADPYRVDIVDAKGSPVWSGPVSRDAAGLFVDGHSFRSGRYWVRLFDKDNTQAGEYRLDAK
jgi:anti-sigma factor RsiW